MKGGKKKKNSDNQDKTIKRSKIKKDDKEIKKNQSKERK